MYIGRGASGRYSSLGWPRMRGAGAGPRSRLIGGGKLGSDGRASSFITGERMAGRPPEGTRGLVREPVAQGSGARAA